MWHSETLALSYKSNHRYSKTIPRCSIANSMTLCTSKLKRLIFWSKLRIKIIVTKFCKSLRSTPPMLILRSLELLSELSGKSFWKLNLHSESQPKWSTTLWRMDRPLPFKRQSLLQRIFFVNIQENMKTWSRTSQRRMMNILKLRPKPQSYGLSVNTLKRFPTLSKSSKAISNNFWKIQIQSSFLYSQLQSSSISRSLNRARP